MATAPTFTQQNLVALVSAATAVKKEGEEVIAGYDAIVNQEAEVAAQQDALAVLTGKQGNEVSQFQAAIDSLVAAVTALRPPAAP